MQRIFKIWATWCSCTAWHQPSGDKIGGVHSYQTGKPNRRANENYPD